MLKVALYSQKKDKESLNYIRNFAQILEKKNVQIFLFEDLKNDLNFSGKSFVFCQQEDLEKQQINYFFSFGGDGTILSALNLIQDLEIPVVGVNMGRLGFLANFTQSQVLEDLDKILAGKMYSSSRSVIELQSPQVDFPFALNDLTITRKETTSMITVEAEINGKFLSVFWGDGLIVATPSGSTAYSLSCGGPIIEPENESFALTPIAPHNLNMRPIILNDDVEIKLKVSGRVPEYSLGLDARLYTMNTEDELIIKKAKFHLQLIFPENTNFYETLRKKLLWGNDTRN